VDHAFQDSQALPPSTTASQARGVTTSAAAGDVMATVSDGGFPLTAGKQAAWTVTARNVGTSAATGVTTMHYPVPLGKVATGMYPADKIWDLVNCSFQV
jgi:hypothetical protein